MADLAEAATRPFDPGCDPQKLMQFGHLVRQNLARTEGAHRLDVPGADLYLVPGFLTRRDCADVVRVINSRATPSTLYRGREQPGFRTSFTHHFERDDPYTRDIEDYIDQLLGIDNVFGETMQGQRYQVGQQFKHHHDFFHVGEGYWREEAGRGGQRTWTAMVFLNEPREGGETDFPHLGVSLRPVTGTLVIWNNADPGGKPNMKTLHAGLPVRRGIKHVITKWYRQDPWRLLNA